ncbi:MAG: polyamine aminopropyltransferase [Gemmataceae bacterium]
MNRTPILFLNVLIIATCGLIYELQAATLSSFVLGDSVTQFSLIIGLYLSALGVGAWLSGFIDRGLARAFLEVELAVALLGGFSVPLLYLTYTRPSAFLPTLYGTVFVVGTLVGLELPLLMRIVREQLDFKELVSRVLTFDYIGALVASVLFPLFFVPRLGLVRTSLVFGMLNAGVALWGTWLMRPLIVGSVTGLRVRAVFLLAFLGLALFEADALTRWTEEDIFDGRVVFAKTTPYQRIVLVENRQGIQLHLNAHLQFSSIDEYRYHEALAHPALLSATSPRRVLILGGGDGLALREVLRLPSVEQVTLVDIDPDMTGLASTFPALVSLNQHAYADPRVEVVNQDALLYLEGVTAQFDVVLIDFPDPHSFSLGKLYTSRFFRLLKSRLRDEGALAIQATSPLATRKSYWCIIRTMEAAGFLVRPYTVGLPSFGIWGFALARKAPFEIPQGALPGQLRFLDAQTLRAMFVIPPDLGPVEVKINRLDNQQLVRYYESERRRGE